MAQYMARQSSKIKQEINIDGQEQDMSRRQANVAEWIRQKAEDHRSTSMFEQVYCFEKLKEKLLPIIEEELGLAPMTAGGPGQGHGEPPKD
jgi:hypothetical protein